MRHSLFAFTLIAAASLMCSFELPMLEEFGKAGYYADSLHGRKTASGEKYDKNELTCAHKSLPFGTKVKVTRLDNKKSVVVRVNDRGPFVDGYVVDLSRRAAEAIGLVRDGVTRVKVEVVEASTQARVAAETDGNAKLLVAREDAKQKPQAVSKVAKGVKPTAYNSSPRPLTAGAAGATELYKVDLKKAEKAGYGIQISTLNDAGNVLPMLSKLQAQWPGKSMVLTEKGADDGSASYKMIVGPYPDKKSAETQQKIAARKYKGCFVVDLSDL